MLISAKVAETLPLLCDKEVIVLPVPPVPIGPPSNALIALVTVLTVAALLVEAL